MAAGGAASIAAAGGGMMDKLKGVEPPKDDAADATYKEKQQLMDNVDIIASDIVKDSKSFPRCQ